MLPLDVKIYQTRSIYGFGTAFYGSSDRRLDGSFITTKWIIAFALPLIPLRSFRLRYVSEKTVSQYRKVVTTGSYTYIGKVPLNLKQVFFIWFVAIIQIVLVIGTALLMGQFLIPGRNPMLIFFPGVFVMMFFLYVLGPMIIYKPK